MRAANPLIHARMTADTTSTRLWAGRRERHAVGPGGNAMWQVNIPAPFAVIHLQHNACVAGKVVAGGMDDDVIRSHLRNRDGTPLAEQLHFYDGGMAAATGLQNYVG